jgi:hypothetical protein
MGEKEDERSAQAGQLFENFVQASTCKGTLQAFSILCRQMDLDPLDYRNFYSNLKATVTNWKAKALWTKLDKRAGHKEYKKAKACEGTRVRSQSSYHSIANAQVTHSSVWQVLIFNLVPYR